MPLETYGDAKIKEVQFSAKEVIDILAENLKARGETAQYTFNYESPIVLYDGRNILMRFVTNEVVRERDLRRFDMKPMPEAAS